MASKTILLLLLVAVATTLAQRKCCYPSTFEGFFSDIVANSAGGQGMVQTLDYQYAYDNPNGRVGGFANKGMVKYQFIYDYGKKMFYRIEIHPEYSSCEYGSLNGTLPQCVPSGASFLGSSYYGDHKFTVDYFQYFDSSSAFDYANVTLTVSEGNCIPVSVVTIGVKDNVPTLGIRGFANYSSGISDPSKYFTVPDLCKTDEKLKMQLSPFDKILP